MRLICGMDEAGRGPLAGPIVAAAVIAPEDTIFEGARDSKSMTEKGREAWAEAFKATAKERGIQFVVIQIGVTDINQYGIGWANREIFRRLITRIDADEYIVDGRYKIAELVGDKRQRTFDVVRADTTHPIVAAASILAKTSRDKLMRELDEKYPHYGWAKNKGYGTQQHVRALKTFGSTPHHRGQYITTAQANQRPGYAQPLLFLNSGLLLTLALLSQGIQNMA